MSSLTDVWCPESVKDKRSEVFADGSVRRSSSKQTSCVGMQIKAYSVLSTSLPLGRGGESNVYDWMSIRDTWCSKKNVMDAAHGSHSYKTSFFFFTANDEH